MEPSDEKTMPCTRAHTGCVCDYCLAHFYSFDSEPPGATPGPILPRRGWMPKEAWDPQD